MLSEPVNSEKSDPPYCTVYIAKYIVYTVYGIVYIVLYNVCIYLIYYRE